MPIFPKRNWRIRAILLVATLTAISIGAGTGVSANEHVDQAGGPLELLSTDRTNEDLIPEFADFSTELDRISARFVAESGGASHWAVQNHENEICLISVLSDTQKSSLTCAGQTDFVENGLALRIAGSPGEPVSETHLVPDGYADDVAAVTGWEKVTPNLLSADPTARTLDLERVELKDGFRVHDLPPTQGDMPLGQSVSVDYSSRGLDAETQVRYAYRQEVEPGTRILSHEIRDGDNMLGGFHNIYPDVVRATICGETTSSHPPNHLYYQSCGRGYVDYDHGSYFGISRCFWAEDSAGDAPLTCRYKR